MLAHEVQTAQVLLYLPQVVLVLQKLGTVLHEVRFDGGPAQDKALAVLLLQGPDLPAPLLVAPGLDLASPLEQGHAELVLQRVERVADALPGVLHAQVDHEVAFVDFAEVHFVEGLEF